MNNQIQIAKTHKNTFIYILPKINTAFSYTQNCICSNKNEYLQTKQIMDPIFTSAAERENKSFSVRSNFSRRSSKSSKSFLNNDQKYQLQTKLDKRSSGRYLQTENSQEHQIQRVFRIHCKNKIGKFQAITSLKLLGYSCKSEEDFAKFNKIWAKYGENYISTINEAAFKLMVNQIKGKGQLKDNYQVFTIMAEQKNSLDRFRLQAIGKQVGRDVRGIIQTCGKDGAITYNQFEAILKFTNSFKW